MPEVKIMSIEQVIEFIDLCNKMETFLINHLKKIRQHNLGNRTGMDIDDDIRVGNSTPNLWSIAESFINKLNHFYGQDLHLKIENERLTKQLERIKSILKMDGNEDKELWP